MTEKLSDSYVQRIADNIKRTLDNVKNTAVLNGRSADEISVMAVTKTVPAEIVNIAVDCGVILLGENRVQEYLSKKDDYKRQNTKIHMIGKLQRNKVKYIFDNVDVIESVDNIELAGEINKRCAVIKKVMPIFVEVKLAESDTKSGVSPQNLENLLYELSKLSNISVEGLMTIPPYTTIESEQRRYFSQMYKLFIDIKSKNIDNIKIGHLSMGMSGDYPTAIAEGCTEIRLGTVLFGER